MRDISLRTFEKKFKLLLLGPVNYLLVFVVEVLFLNLVISEKKVTSGFSYKEEHSVLL